MNKHVTSTCAAFALWAGACVIPPEQPPSVTPGSPASIGGATAATPAAAAPAPAVAAPLKNCGEDALVDDGEDGDNKSSPNGGRAGFWYTFKDKGSTTVEPQAGAFGGGAFTMSEGGHGSSWAARFHGKIGTGAVVFAGLGVNFVDPKGRSFASTVVASAFYQAGSNQLLLTGQGLDSGQTVDYALTVAQNAGQPGFVNLVLSDGVTIAGNVVNGVLELH